MWTKASQLARLAINRSGAQSAVEAERIIQITNSLGKNQFKGVFFRQGFLVIAAQDADPVALQADSLKIQNTINKIIGSQAIKKIRITSS